MKKIAIILLTRDWESASSRVSVVKTQLRCLVENKYKPRILMLNGCPKWNYQGRIDYRDCLPNDDHNVNSGQSRKQLENHAVRCAKILEKHLQDMDKVITHDILYLERFLPYNIAVRKAALKLPKIQWLHWVHSRPKPRPPQIGYPGKLRFEAMPHSKFITTTASDVQGLAKMYGVTQSDIKVVYNTRFTSEFMGWDTLSSKMMAKCRLLDADIVSIFPTSLSRRAKQLEICLYVVAALKALHQNVRMIFVDSYLAGYEQDTQIRLMQLKWLAQQLGLSTGEVIFTSEVDPRLRKGCSERLVRNLFQISNVFIHPSRSETCSITLLEAAATKNLCVLNEDIASFREISKDSVVWMRCGNPLRDIKKRYGAKRVQGKEIKFFHQYYLDHKGDYRKCAKKIISALARDKSLALFTDLKKRFNEKLIYEKQFGPLIESEY